MPKEVREHLGIKPGERLRFVFEGKQTIVRRNPFAKYAGTLGNFDGDINKINDWIRDMRRD